MSEIFFCSDTHFCHDQPFLYEPRGFSSVEEMNEKIVENWNKVVPKDGITYLLGDEMLNDNEKAIQYMKQLNGQIYFIWGNHSTDTRKKLIFRELPNACGGWYAYQIKSGKWNFYLSHYPTKVGNYDDEKIHSKFFALAGHTHTKDKFLDMKDKCYHVEMDAHDCYPVNLEQIKEDIKQYNNIKPTV